MSNYNTLSDGLKYKFITAKDPDSIDTKRRVGSFLSKCKNYAIAATLSATATLGIMVYSGLNSNNAFDVESMEKTDNYEIADVAKNLSFHSLFVNEKYIDTNNKVIIVSEKDHNLTKIIANTDISIAPKYIESEDLNIFQELETLMFETYHSVFSQENEQYKNWAYLNLNSDILGPHALSIYENNDWNKAKVCYMRPHKEHVSLDDGYNHGQLGTRVYINGYEMINIVSNHEEGHCLDFGESHYYEAITDNEPHRDPLTKTLQKETVADIYAAMVTVRDTGNLDTVKYTLLPFRMMPNHDEKHQSTVSIREFISDFDNEESIKSLASLSNLELFKKAEKYYFINNINALKNERSDFSKAESIFKSLLTDELSVSNLVSKLKEGDTVYSEVADINEISSKEMQDLTVEYGKSLIKTYMEHLNYHEKSDNLESLSSTVRFIAKTYHFMGQKENAEKVEAFYGNKDPSRLKQIVLSSINDMGISLDNNVGLISSNMEKMKILYEKDIVKRDEIKNKLENGEYDFSQIKLNVTPNTKDKILERLKNENKPSSEMNLF